jgi:hypothetical protein
MERKVTSNGFEYNRRARHFLVISCLAGLFISICFCVVAKKCKLGLREITVLAEVLTTRALPVHVSDIPVQSRNLLAK